MQHTPPSHKLPSPNPLPEQLPLSSPLAQDWQGSLSTEASCDDTVSTKHQTHKSKFKKKPSTVESQKPAKNLCFNKVQTHKFSFESKEKTVGISETLTRNAVLQANSSDDMLVVDTSLHSAGGQRTQLKTWFLHEKQVRKTACMQDSLVYERTASELTVEERTDHTLKENTPSNPQPPNQTTSQQQSNPVVEGQFKRKRGLEPTEHSSAFLSKKLKLPKPDIGQRPLFRPAFSKASDLKSEDEDFEHLKLTREISELRSFRKGARELIDESTLHYLDIIDKPDVVLTNRSLVADRSNSGLTVFKEATTSKAFSWRL